MRICLGSTPEMSGYTHCADITSLSRNVLEAEASSIICKNFLSGFYWTEIKKVLDIVLSKVRLNGEVQISEPDFDLISRQIFREEVELKTVNSTIFSHGGLFKSFLNLELIESLIPSGFEVITKHYDSSSFSIKIKRVQ